MTTGVSATPLYISQAGILFTIPKAMVVGQHIIVDMLPGAAEKRSKHVRAEVCRVGPSAQAAHFDVGCKFIERLSYAHLQAFS
jgi:hypothetical protein